MQITKDLVKNEDSGTNLGQGWGVYISNRLLRGIIFWLVYRTHFFFQTLNFFFFFLVKLLFFFLTLFFYFFLNFILFLNFT